MGIDDEDSDREQAQHVSKNNFELDGAADFFDALRAHSFRQQLAALVRCSHRALPLFPLHQLTGNDDEQRAFLLSELLWSFRLNLHCKASSRSSSEGLIGPRKMTDSLVFSTRLDPKRSQGASPKSVVAIGELTAMLADSRIESDDMVRTGIELLQAEQFINETGVEGSGLSEDQLVSALIAEFETLRQASNDLNFLDYNGSLSELHRQPLIRQAVSEKAARKALSFQEEVADLGEGFDFWAKWFQRLLIGENTDHLLEIEMLEIPNSDWNKGYDHIGKVIAGLELPYTLREQIRDLKAEIATLKGDPPPMGHNMPPEMIEDASPQQTMAIIWAAVAELEEELDKGQPNQTRLEQLQKKLTALAAKAGTLAKDVAYDNAKTATTAAASAAIGANWAAIQSALTSISTTVLDWIAYFIWLVL